MTQFDKCLAEMRGRGIPREDAYRLCYDMFPMEVTEEQKDVVEAYAEATKKFPKYLMNQPARADGVSVNQLLAVLVVLKLSKTKEGLRTIQILGKQFLQGVFNTLHALGQASAANQVSAWANPYLVSLVLERFGFVASNRMLEYRMGLNIIAGAGVAEGFLDVLQGMFPFTTPEPSPYPSSIVFSAPSPSKETISALRQELTEKEG